MAQSPEPKPKSRSGLLVVAGCAIAGALIGAAIGVTVKDLRFMDMGLFAGLAVGFALSLIQSLRSGA